MKKMLYKSQAGDADLTVNVYVNESCTPNGRCTNYECTDNACDGSSSWPVFINDLCVNRVCVNNGCPPSN